MPLASPAPSVEVSIGMEVSAASSVPSTATILAVLLGPDGPVDERLHVDRTALESVGFSGQVGSTVAVPTTGQMASVAVGIGPVQRADAATIRDAAAAFGRVSGTHTVIAISLPHFDDLSVASAAQAAVEGVLLSRYRYDVLRSEPRGAVVTSVTVIVDDADVGDATEGAERGRVMAAATKLSRDLANCPHSHLTASVLADLAETLGPQHGLSIEVFGKEQLVEMGCGGMLGVNAGSSEPPRLIKMTYRPTGEPTGHLAIVGKGLMYDSGGLSLKPGDEVHAQMKNDMTGAASTFGAMCVLQAAACPAAVTAYLMCTDNMPSSTAMALGDVLTIRNGTTVEVINTDAEGRLVMADGLVLAVEDGCDAVIDIATLTGACMRALGTSLAGVMGNNDALIDQVRAAGALTDEPVWELPLEQRYRKDIDSPIADLRNLGTTPNGGAIHAALFLAEFVGDTPWAHIDIAGVAQTPADTLWHTAGCSGFGARLLVELASGFTAP
jgi:leucyl aminopeptidase